jgi:hypothetical protein
MQVAKSKVGSRGQMKKGNKSLHTRCAYQIGNIRIVIGIDNGPARVTSMRRLSVAWRDAVCNCRRISDGQWMSPCFNLTELVRSDVDHVKLEGLHLNPLPLR